MMMVMVMNTVMEVTAGMLLLLLIFSPAVLSTELSSEPGDYVDCPEIQEYWKGNFCRDCPTGYEQDYKNRTLCMKRECTSAFINGGRATPTFNGKKRPWLWGGFLDNGCNDDNAYVIGADLRYCYQDPERQIPFWRGATNPQCTGICGKIWWRHKVTDQPLIRPLSDMGEKRCLEKGGCYQDNKCYATIFDKAFVRYTMAVGKQFLADPHPFRQPETHFLPGEHTYSCAYTCKYSTSVECKTFVTFWDEDVRHPTTKEAFPTCYLLTNTREEVKEAGGDGEKGAVYHEIQPDGKAFEDIQEDVVKALQIGCYSYKKGDWGRVRVEGDAMMTVPRCIRVCRAQGFTMAGVTGGDTCVCGEGTAGLTSHQTSTECTAICPGSVDTTCGGVASIYIYEVSIDHRYIGCYEEDASFSSVSPSPDIVPQCISECRSQGRLYAAVKEGGSVCGCGDSFPSGSLGDRAGCFSLCAGYRCGGNTTNAVYITEKATELTGSFLPRVVSHIYDLDEEMTGFTTTIFNHFPGLRSIVSKRLVVYASEGIQTPSEAGADFETAYSDCGEMNYLLDQQEVGQDVTLRFNFVRLSQLHRYVGSDTRRVYLYAQIVYADGGAEKYPRRILDFQFPFSVLIRARLIVIDRHRTHTIGIAIDTPELENLDWETVKQSGPPPDMIHLRQSFICARTLAEMSGDMVKEKYGWDIIQDILEAAHSNPAPEEKEFISMVRSHASRLGGTLREDVHVVPTLSLERLRSVLQTLDNEIDVYKEDWDKFELEQGYDKALQYSYKMQKIAAETSTENAEIAFRNALETLTVNERTYTAMYSKFKESRKTMRTRAKELEEAIRKAQVKSILNGLLGFIKGIVNLGVAIYKSDPLSAFNAAFDAFDGLRKIDLTIMALNNVIREMETFIRSVTNVNQELANTAVGFDAEKYSYNIDRMVKMKTQVIEWNNLKNAVQGMIYENSKFQKISASSDYAISINNLLNWGEALTKSMIEKAENMRQAMQMRLLADNKKKQEKRIQGVIDEAGQKQVSLQKLKVTMTDLTFDVRLQLNDALVLFCEAYFFERLQQCPPRARPNFSGNLGDLQKRIASASRSAILNAAAPSSLSRRASFKDAGGICTNMMECPVHSLQKYNQFSITISPNHTDFSDIDQIRVKEIQIDVIGAKVQEGHEDQPSMKFMIDATGEFQGRSRGKVYNFLMKPVHKTFERNIQREDDITLHADIYENYMSTFSYMTPFTTWYFQLDTTRSRFIDFSQATEIRLRVLGHYRSAAVRRTRYVA